MSEYYFAKPTGDIGTAIRDQIDKYYEFLLVSGVLGLHRTSYYQYHSGFFNGGGIASSGPAGEYREITSGDYRNLIQHRLQLVTSQKPKWVTKSTNSDYKSQVQAILGPGLLDYYTDRGGLLREAIRMAEFAIYQGSGYLMVEYDQLAGEPIATMAKKATDFNGDPLDEPMEVPVMGGDVYFKSFEPIDMVKDWQSRDPHHPVWLMPREFISKWILADQYPHLRDQIEAVQPTIDFTWDIDDWTLFRRAQSDLLPVFTLYHKPTATLPKGRKVRMVYPDIVLEDGELGYENIPIACMIPSTIDRTSIGYTDAWDLLSLQRSKDILRSTILTNQMSFGVQNIMIEDGTNIAASELSEGLNLIKYPTGAHPPQALQLTQSSPELFKFIQDLSQQMEINFGINGVTRGQPDPSLKSGNALALVQAQAIQFATLIQTAYIGALEYAGNATFDCLRKKLPDKKKLAIVGKIPGQLLKAFDAADLDGIDNVRVDMGNPVTATIAGRTQMAENFVQQGLIKDTKEYLQVVTTGNLEVAIEGVEAENLLIKSEQEQLLQGIVPPVLWTDDHRRHIQAALDLLSTPEARENPTILQNVFAFIQQHIDISAQTPPDKLMAIGRQPLAPPPMPPPPGAGGPPPAPPNMPQGAPGIPNGQKLPDNPLTGQEYNPVNGGQPLPSTVK